MWKALLNSYQLDLQIQRHETSEDTYLWTLLEQSCSKLRRWRKDSTSSNDRSHCIHSAGSCSYLPTCSTQVNRGLVPNGYQSGKSINKSREDICVERTMYKAQSRLISPIKYPWFDISVTDMPSTYYRDVFPVIRFGVCGFCHFGHKKSLVATKRCVSVSIEIKSFQTY